MESVPTVFHCGMLCLGLRVKPALDTTCSTYIIMNYLQQFYNKTISIFTTNSVYLNMLYKAFVVIAVSFVIWLVLKGVIKLIEKKIKKYEFLNLNAKFFKAIRKAALYVIILGAGASLINIFNIQLFNKVFYAFFVILLASPVKNLLTISLTYLQNNVANKTETKIDNIVFDLLNKFAGAIIYVAVVILALDILGINIMPFIAGAGVAGIAIGFAAKDTLSNFIAGVLLIIDRPFEIGDRIEVWEAPVGSATWGDVIDIGLRATKIKTTDNIIIIIPNNEIMKRDIINYTIIDEKIRVRINIGISYDADIAKTKGVIIKIANSASWIAKDPPPEVVVQNFGESSVDLQLRVWIHNARKRMQTISYITDKAKEAFDKEGIEIPYPKRDITIIHKSKQAT